MRLGEKSTLLMVLIAVLWLCITIMGWNGQWFPAMFLGIILMLIHMMMGASKKGILNTKLFIYPMLSWAILWGISFYLSYYHAQVFAGKMPDFTILGFHPSFGWTVLVYWLGGVATLTIGFIMYKDLWLSEKDWEEFKEKIDRMNQEKGGEYSDIRS